MNAGNAVERDAEILLRQVAPIDGDREGNARAFAVLCLAAALCGYRQFDWNVEHAVQREQMQPRLEWEWNQLVKLLSHMASWATPLAPPGIGDEDLVDEFLSRPAPEPMEFPFPPDWQPIGDDRHARRIGPYQVLVYWTGVSRVWHSVAWVDTPLGRLRAEKEGLPGRTLMAAMLDAEDLARAIAEWRPPAAAESG